MTYWLEEIIPYTLMPNLLKSTKNCQSCGYCVSTNRLILPFHKSVVINYYGLMLFLKKKFEF